MRKKTNAIALFLLILILCAVAISSNSNRAQAGNALQNQAGPTLGENIDLTSWSTRDGRTLAQIIKGHSLAMVLLVNPACGTCAEARDGFRTLRDRAGKPGIPYYVLMIPDNNDRQRFFSYADSLKLDADSFVWSNSQTKAPTALAMMAVPSHLLVTNEGMVVEKWPGTTPKE